MIIENLMDGGTLNMLIPKYNIEYQNATSFAYEHPSTSSSLQDCLFDKMREYLIVLEVPKEKRINIDSDKSNQDKAGS